MASIVNLREGFRNNFKSGLLSKLTYDYWTWLPICHIRGNVGTLVSPKRAPIRCTDSFSFAIQATIIARCKLCLSQLYRPVFMWHCQMFKECTHILKPMFIWSCRLKWSADDTHATEPRETERKYSELTYQERASSEKSNCFGKKTHKSQVLKLLCKHNKRAI